MFLGGAEAAEPPGGGVETGDYGWVAKLGTGVPGDPLPGPDLGEHRQRAPEIRGQAAMEAQYRGSI